MCTAHKLGLANMSHKRACCDALRRFIGITGHLVQPVTRDATPIDVPNPTFFIFLCVSNGCDLYPYTNEFRSIDSKLHSNMFHMKCCQLTHTRAQSFLLEVGHRSALPWARAQGALCHWTIIGFTETRKQKILVQLAQTVLLSWHNLSPNKETRAGWAGQNFFPVLCRKF